MEAEFDDIEERVSEVINRRQSVCPDSTCTSQDSTASTASPAHRTSAETLRTKSAQGPALADAAALFDPSGPPPGGELPQAPFQAEMFTIMKTITHTMTSVPPVFVHTVTLAATSTSTITVTPSPAVTSNRLPPRAAPKVTVTSTITVTPSPVVTTIRLPPTAAPKVTITSTILGPPSAPPEGTVTASEAVLTISMHASIVFWTVTLAWLVLWAITLFRGNSPFRTFLILSPSFIPPFLIYSFASDLASLHTQYTSPAFNYKVIVAIGIVTFLVAVVLVLDTIGVVALLTELQSAFRRWWSSDGWTFQWGWQRNHKESLRRAEKDRRHDPLRAYHSGDQPWDRPHGRYC